jgi:hypothetical protein
VVVSNDFNGLKDTFLRDRDPSVGTYCTPKLNSLGCLPLASCRGIASASAATRFFVDATSIRNQKLGLFFYSVAGAASIPFYGGTQCVNTPIVRTPIQASGGSSGFIQDCTGSYRFDLNAWVATGRDPGLAVGVQVWGQFWGRDPGFAPPYNITLTNAITFVVGP